MLKMKLKIELNAFKNPICIVKTSLPYLEIWEMEALHDPFFSIIGSSPQDCYYQAEDQIINYLITRN